MPARRLAVTLPPFGDQCRVVCVKQLCEGNGEDSVGPGPCSTEDFAECVDYCRGHVATLDATCAACLLDASHIEDFDGSCRFSLQSVGAEACAGFCP